MQIFFYKKICVIFFLGSFLLNFSDDAIRAAENAKSDVADLLVEHLLNRFGKEYGDEILTAMSIFDRMSWSTEKTFGQAEIRKIGAHFSEPLAFANYNEEKVICII